ncbi:MAG TPA: hypothetical protein VHA09_06860 [Nitrososphaera sp.]|nr:hypothetical protein [Nitrososphaera sp.]
MYDKSLVAGFIAVTIIGLLSLAFSLTNSVNVYAQYAPPIEQNPPSPTTTTPTPQMLQECKDLGISPEKCSENEILKHHCFGAVGSPCGTNNEPSQPELSPFVVQILAGSGIAFVASIFAIRKLRAIKKSRLSGTN